MKKLICLLCAVCLLVGCAPVEEAVVPEYVLTYAENQPEGYPTTLGALKFAELVSQRTGGKVLIQVKADAEFGSQQQVLEQMAFGGVDFARVSLSSLSDELPILNVLQLPFLYSDAEHMWRILDGEIGAQFLQVFDQAGLVGLSWYDGGARSFYASTPIRNVSDFEGLTVRVQNSRMMADMVKLLGGTPVMLDYSEIYAALETGQIDAAENNWPSYQQLEHYTHAPYYTVDTHARVPEVQLVSGRTWETLPEEYRRIIAQCAAESALYERELWKEQESASRITAIEAGCQEILLTASEYQRFQTAVEPLYKQYCGEYLDLINSIKNG